MQLLGRIILERMGDVKWELVHFRMPTWLEKIHPLRSAGKWMMFRKSPEDGLGILIEARGRESRNWDDVGMEEGIRQGG